MVDFGFNFYGQFLIDFRSVFWSFGQYSIFSRCWIDVSICNFVDISVDPLHDPFSGFLTTFCQNFIRTAWCDLGRTLLCTIFDLILGYTDVVKGLVRMGLLSPNEHPALHAQVNNRDFYLIFTRNRPQKLLVLCSA